MKIPTQKLRDVSEAIIQKVDGAIAPLNSVYLAVNLVFDDVIGRACVRKGTTQLGAQLVDNKSILGLYQFNKTDGTKVPLAVVNDAGDANSDIFKESSGWAIATGGTNLTKDIKCHFVTFLDTVAILNGSDACRSSADGATFVTTSGNLDVGNMPQGKYGIEFKDRIYVAGVSGNLDRLCYSSTPTAGAISWTSGNGNIDIEIEEGAGPITGLAKVPGYLLVFKERSLKRWDSFSTYPESLIDIGAPSQEAIVQTRQSVFYFNKRGIYETTGNYPRKISRRIQDIIEAIPSSYYSSVSGWGDGEKVYFSIGDITLDDLSLTNCVIMYSIESQSWTLLSFPNEFKVWGSYVDTNGDEIVMAGDDDGGVWKIMSGVGDDGEDISFILQSQPQEIGSRGRIKDLSKFVVYSKKIRNGQMFCRINEKGDFEPIGNIKNDIQEITKDKKGSVFEFRILGTGTEGEMIGLDFPEVLVNLNYKE